MHPQLLEHFRHSCVLNLNPEHLICDVGDEIGFEVCEEDTKGEDLLVEGEIVREEEVSEDGDDGFVLYEEGVEPDSLGSWALEEPPQNGAYDEFHLIAVAVQQEQESFP